MERVYRGKHAQELARCDERRIVRPALIEKIPYGVRELYPPTQRLTPNLHSLQEGAATPRPPHSPRHMGPVTPHNSPRISHNHIPERIFTSTRIHGLPR